MKEALISLFVLFVATSAMADGKAVFYKVNGESFEGYYISPGPNAPLILLVHDWDGLTDYEIKRANMLADMGYAVFAADLFKSGDTIPILLTYCLSRYNLLSYGTNSEGSGSVLTFIAHGI